MNLVSAKNKVIAHLDDYTPYLTYHEDSAYENEGDTTPTVTAYLSLKYDRYFKDGQEKFGFFQTVKVNPAALKNVGETDYHKRVIGYLLAKLGLYLASQGDSEVPSLDPNEADPDYVKPEVKAPVVEPGYEQTPEDVEAVASGGYEDTQLEPGDEIPAEAIVDVPTSTDEDAPADTVHIDETTNEEVIGDPGDEDPEGRSIN